MIPIKNSRAIEKMRAVNKIVANAHALVEDHIRIGITTKELDRIAEEYILSQGAKPNFKNYNGFPAATCISVNDCVIHGIPSDYALQDGDLVSLDFGAVKDGFHGDAARSYTVGKASRIAQKLTETAKACFYAALAEARSGRRVGDIGKAVEETAQKNGFSVVRAYTGHGIGKKLHEDPCVPNHGPAGSGALLRPGYTIAIEPMICEGGYQIQVGSDNWTVRTKDGGLSAHYENTVLITHGDPEILSE